MRMLEETIVVSNHVAFQSTLHDRLPPYGVWMSIERPPHAERYRELSLQVRTDRARQLLAEGNLSVTQIAYRLGLSLIHI